MKKETKIAIAAVLATSAAAAATATLITCVRLLSDVAVKKDLPKIPVSVRNKISGGPIIKDDNIVNLAQKKSEALRALCTEKVTVTNRDGLTLTGHWYRALHPKRIVIAMHGWRSSWSHDFGMIADFLHTNDCSVLFPDQRSHGESEGEHIGFGVLERYDCADWVNHVVQIEDPTLPVYLCGISMGATTVLMASELELSDRVKGIISDCGFTSPYDIWEHVMNDNLKINSKLAFQMANHYISRKAHFDAKEASTLTAVANTKIPILFVHGDADGFVPVEMTKKNYDACASEKQILIVPGAEHGLSFCVDGDSYKKAVLDFFSKYDN